MCNGVFLSFSHIIVSSKELYLIDSSLSQSNSDEIISGSRSADAKRMVNIYKRWGSFNFDLNAISALRASDSSHTTVPGRGTGRYSPSLSNSLQMKCCS